MKTETLVVTIDQKDHSLAERMNVQTDTVVCNQSDFVSDEVFEYRGNKVIYINRNDRGVGKNRNRSIDNATGDILVLADDDMCFVDGYKDIVEKCFNDIPDADILIFNLIEKNPRRYRFREPERIGNSNYARFGAARFALKRKSIIDSGVRFSTQFGGGAKYSSGEDTIFLKDCLRKKLKIYGVPYALAEIDQNAESTWFKGYNEKYYYDKGAAYTALGNRFTATIYCFRYLIKYRSQYKGKHSFFRLYRLMIKGIMEYRSEE
ncbi:MAG: glycosyltransferase [Ruminococcaceae bacterium]|nr:glycosyltransferase [Oscillospiraceae bacterium]